MSKLTCVFCKKRKEPMTEFTNETLQASFTAQKIRKENNLYHGDISLPISVTGTHVGCHVKCYNNYVEVVSRYKPKSKAETGISKGSSGPPPSNWVLTKSMLDDYVRSMELMMGNPSDLDTECILCHKKTGIKNEALSQCNDEDVIAVKSTATKFSDLVILRNIDLLSSKMTKPKCHNSCKKKYCAESFLANPFQDYLGNTHENAFKTLCSFIKENMISRATCFLLEYLETMYLDFLYLEYKVGLYDFKSNFFASKHLKDLILQKFKGQISIIEKCNQEIVKPLGADANKIDLQTLKANVKQLKNEITKRLAHVKSEKKTKTFYPIPDIIAWQLERDFSARGKMYEKNSVLGQILVKCFAQIAHNELYGTSKPGKQTGDKVPATKSKSVKQAKK